MLRIRLHGSGSRVAKTCESTDLDPRDEIPTKTAIKNLFWIHFFSRELGTSQFKPFIDDGQKPKWTVRPVRSFSRVLFLIKKDPFKYLLVY